MITRPRDLAGLPALLRDLPAGWVVRVYVKAGEIATMTDEDADLLRELGATEVQLEDLRAFARAAPTPEHVFTMNLRLNLSGKPAAGE